MDVTCETSGAGPPPKEPLPQGHLHRTRGLPPAAQTVAAQKPAHGVLTDDFRIPQA